MLLLNGVVTINLSLFLVKRRTLPEACLPTLTTPPAPRHRRARAPALGPARRRLALALAAAASAGLAACDTHGTHSRTAPSATVAAPALQVQAQPGGPIAPPGAPTLRFIAGSTTKLEQLVGEEDRERHVPTLSRTFTRYQIRGTDLGYSFEHEGRAFFLFGDTVGRLGGALDTIATTTATDPETGVRLDFLMNGNRYLTVQPPGIRMGAFEVPVSGISLGGQMYVVVRTNHSADWSTDRSVLTRFTLPATFQPLRTISQLPSGHFATMSLHLEPAPQPGMPPGGPYVLMWGTGTYRKSDLFLAIVPAARFADGEGTRYFTGLDARGAPTWSASEADAQPVHRNGTLGDVSVTWCKELGMWLMTYDERAPTHGIAFAYARAPWGPWSEPQLILDPPRDAIGRFIHQAGSNDGLAGPVIGKEAQANPEAVQGGPYAPYVIERFTRVRGSELDLYYGLSTWNPYVVVLMKTRMAIQ